MRIKRTRICGPLVGVAYCDLLRVPLGLEGIPKNWAKQVENSSQILHIADELFRLRDRITGGATA